MYTVTVSEDLPVELGNIIANAETLNRDEIMSRFEREYFLLVWRKCKGNKTRMAKEMGVNRKTVYRLMWKYGGKNEKIRNETF